ncbi:MAG: ABC transporter permease [Gammaproteobacteria bacterium]|nr:ABC transporter permease [Gammaproteobacteria bacterium]
MRRWLDNAGTGSYLLLLYGFIYLPVVTLVLFSFQEGRFPIPPFNGPSLRWYEAVAADGKLTSALTHSLLVALLSSALACVLGFLAAYGFARFRLTGAGPLKVMITAPLTVSYLIIGFGLLVTLNLVGVSRSLWTVGIGHVVINTPLCFAIIYASLGEHQRNIERAAQDLGASDLRVMLWVTAPMLMPSIVAAYFLSVTFSWDEFIIAFLLSRFDVTLPVEIWSLLRSGLNPKTNAVGSVVFLVSVVIVLLLEFTVFRRRGWNDRSG